MKKWIVIISLLGLCLPTYAQDVVTAESEDLQMFDQALKSKRLNSKSNTKNDKSVFGDVVSEEAKKLKNTDAQTKSKFGKRVSSEAQKNNDRRGGSEQADKVRGNLPDRGNRGSGRK